MKKGNALSLNILNSFTMVVYIILGVLFFTVVIFILAKKGVGESDVYTSFGASLRKNQKFISERF